MNDLKQRGMGIGSHSEKEIWRQVKGDFYSPSITVNESNGIAIICHGHCLVAPVEAWHDAGNKIFCVDTKLPSWRRKLAYKLLRWNK